jgi:hypothetical protein
MLTVRICVGAVKGGVLKGSEKPAACSKSEQVSKTRFMRRRYFSYFFYAVKKNLVPLCGPRHKQKTSKKHVNQT